MGPLHGHNQPVRPTRSVLGDVSNYNKLMSGWTASVVKDGLTVSFEV